MPKSWQSRTVISLQRHLRFNIIGRSSVRTSEPRQQISVTHPNTEWNRGNPQDSMFSYMMVEIPQQAPKLFFRGSPHITKWIAWHCSPQPERSSHRPFWTLWWGVWERVCGSWNRDRKPKGAEKPGEQLACAGQPRMEPNLGRTEPHRDHTPSLDNIRSFKNRQLSWCS